VWYRFWKFVLGSYFRLQFGLRVEGREHEPAAGPVLVVANHVSTLDPPIVGVALRRQARYMAKQELMDTPVLGWFLRSVGVFPVRRGEADRRSIRVALDALERGGLLVMFPEGTRSPDGRLQAPEPGAALLALRTGAPVLPVAVAGTQHAMPKGAKWPRRTRVVVRMGPTLQPPRREGKIDREELEAWGQRFIASLTALLPGDQQPSSEAITPVREASPPSAGG
jgi:1-acyl-sn-glycerol-3-phosphate acyltransferase